MITDALLEQARSVAEYDRIVREDIEDFRTQAEKYAAGEITDDGFRPARLRRGVYGQRQPGVHMIRTKVPGGNITAAQLRQLARAAEKFAGGKAHLTTRQNFQYHFVPLAQVPDLLHFLADVRLTTREACYNTVRNVTADPMSGLLPGEPFDVHPYARRIAYAFLHREETDNLPRKFKIAFSSSPEDNMAVAMHDVGLRAVVRDGKRGFRVLVGGGLGPLPSEAQLLDEFLPEEQLQSRLEAVVRVFSLYGNRKNKNKARLKFVVRERGFDWVREQIDKEYGRILEQGSIPEPTEIPEGFGGFQAVPPPLGDGRLLPVLDASVPDSPEFSTWRETNVTPQKQAGYFAVTVKVRQGNLSTDQMLGLADIGETAGDGLLRITITQNIVIAFVPGRNLKRVFAALQSVGLAEAGAHQINDVVTCPGAYSCNLALTKAMNLGDALSEAVAGYDDPLVKALAINVSGCPNSCGQHWLGDIGFYGNARKIEGREVPYYLMLLGGGNDSEGMMRFGVAIQSVPARLAPEAARRVLDHYLAHREAREDFRAYVLRFKVETFRALTADLAKPADLFPEIYKDWGDDTNFSLQLGRGECAA